jgi:hypothetical protein
LFANRYVFEHPDNPAQGFKETRWKDGKQIGETGGAGKRQHVFVAAAPVIHITNTTKQKQLLAGQINAQHNMHGQMLAIG